MPMPASTWAFKASSTSAPTRCGRGSDRNRSLARSMAMMSSCLVIAQNGRYGGLSTHAVGSARTLAASSIVGVLIEPPVELSGAELDGCQVSSLGHRHDGDPGFWLKVCVGSESVLPGTARSLRVVLLVVMATVLVVALGRVTGTSPRMAIPQILEPPSPVIPPPPEP